MGRYWLYARSGKFSPIWGHINVNINLQQAGAAMGNLPEASQAFVRWIESLLSDSRVNAQNIFGARGVLFNAHPIQTGGTLEHFEYTWKPGGGTLAGPCAGGEPQQSRRDRRAGQGGHEAGVQYNHMTTSVGYASSSDGPVHFGLGPDARAESIEVVWPSGVLQTLQDVRGDRILTVSEPQP